MDEVHESVVVDNLTRTKAFSPLPSHPLFSVSLSDRPDLCMLVLSEDLFKDLQLVVITRI